MRAIESQYTGGTGGVVSRRGVVGQKKEQ